MVLKIYLADLIHETFPSNSTIPLNIGSVAAYALQKHGSDIDVTLFKYPSDLFQAVDENMPDVVGLSNYSWNQELNRVVTQKLRDRSQNVVICSGGPHIRADNEGTETFMRAHPQIDYYCMMEGEQPFANLVEYFLSANGPVRARNCTSNIDGVAYVRADDQFHFSIIPFKKTDIDDMPSPFLTGILDNFLNSRQLTPLIETNRGCPFHCTFCVWGISSMDKLRLFPLERVVQEIDYIGKLSPSPRWIVADANFGALKRDIEIAQRIKDVENHGKILKSVQFWWGKNSSKRTSEIVKITGKLANPLVAIQTSDVQVLENIKRSNISLDDMKTLMNSFHEDGFEVDTDIIIGLPGETYSSHLQTLRDACSFGFDFIIANNIRLLPGSEMENDETREKYKLKTRFRMISTAYGCYEGECAFEYEESVRSTTTISEEEMFSLRQVHFMLWVLMNLGLAKPLLRWAQETKNINPIDLIFGTVKYPGHKTLERFFEDIEEESRSEWFDSVEELQQFGRENFTNLVEKPFLKINFKYTAFLLLNKEIARLILDSIVAQIGGQTAKDIGDFCFERIWFFGDPFEKSLSIPDHVFRVLEDAPSAADNSSKTYDLKISPANRELITFEFENSQFGNDELTGATMAVESHSSRFFYDIQSACS